MEQFKKAKVIMLPTENKSNIGIVYRDVEKTKGKLVLNLKVNDNYKSYINLYIISDDEIEDGDWFINLLDNSIHQATNWIYVSTCKKIIATTDTSLIENIEMIGTGSTYLFKLPQPSQQFIEKYIESYNKGEVITDVLVEYELENINIHRFEDELKVNPKDNTIIIKKLKNSWNREEVIELFKLREKTIHNYYTEEEWIEENL